MELKQTAHRPLTRSLSVEQLEEEFHHMVNRVEEVITSKLESFRVHSRMDGTELERPIQQGQVNEDREDAEEEPPESVIGRDGFYPSVSHRYTSFLPTTVPRLNVDTIIDDYQLDQLLEEVRKGT
jgi:hypothetical protein